MSRTSLGIALSLVLVASACGGGGDDGSVDATSADASNPDGIGVDAAPDVDAAPTDASDVDGELADAGTDAAEPDAGPPDAGLPDAGMPDAGPPDAGPDAPPPLAGDTCQLAEAVTLVNGAATISGTTSGYGADYAPPAACTSNYAQVGPDRVYAVTVPGGERLSVTMTPTGFDGGLYLVAGPAAMCDASPIACLAGTDAGLSGAAETVTYTNPGAGPLEVFIVVDSYSLTQSGAFTLTVQVGRPAGDTCQLAEAVTLSGGAATITGTSAGSAGYANDYEPPAAGCTGYGAPGLDRAYRVTVPAGQRLWARVVPGDANLDLGVYFVAAPASNCDASPIVCLAGADAFEDGDPELAHYTNTGVTAMDVFVIVDSYWAGEGGPFTLDLRVGAVPPGETCQLAPTLSVGTTTGTTIGYVDDYRPATSCTGYAAPGADRAYLVSIPGNQTLTATVTPGVLNDAALYLVATPALVCDASPLVCLDGSDDALDGGAETVSYTNPGPTPIEVFVVVDSYYVFEEYDFTLAVSVAP